MKTKVHFIFARSTPVFWAESEDVDEQARVGVNVVWVGCQMAELLSEQTSLARREQIAMLSQYFDDISIEFGKYRIRSNQVFQLLVRKINTSKYDLGTFSNQQH